MDKAFDFKYHQELYPAIDPKRLDVSAKGKTVVVTGGGKSIGRAITESFAIAKAKHIAILGRDDKALQEVKEDLESRYDKSKIHTFNADITDTSACKKAFSEIKEGLGPIDVLVLNAGYLSKPENVEDMDIEEFWKSFEVNVKGNTTVTQLFCKACSETATLINISSWCAWLPPVQFPLAAYSGAKAGFDVIVRYLAFQKPNLRVFTLHPGSIASPMTGKLGVDLNAKGLWADPMLPGAMCVYLASPRGEYLRGKSIEVNWDVEDMEKHKDELKAPPRGNPSSMPAEPLTVGLIGRSREPESSTAN